MFILTQYDKCLTNERLIGGSIEQQHIMDLAMTMATEMLRKNSTHGIETGTIKQVVVDGGVNIYYKTSSSTILKTWTIREIPTITGDIND